MLTALIGLAITVLIQIIAVVVFIVRLEAKVSTASTMGTTNQSNITALTRDYTRTNTDMEVLKEKFSNIEAKVNSIDIKVDGLVVLMTEIAAGLSDHK